MFLRRYSRHGLWLLLLLLLLALTAQSQQTRFTLSEDDPRALATISQYIAQHTHSLITYEELGYEHRNDLAFYPDENPSHPLPRHLRFTFTYDATDDVRTILQNLIENHDEQASGSYKVIEEQGVFHILPDASKDESGAFMQRASILDLPVSVRLEQATGREVACEVLRQLQERWQVETSCLTGYKGQVFGDLFYDEYEVEELPAREHLTRLRLDSSKRLSWHILRGADGRYGVNFFIQQWDAPTPQRNQ